MADKFSKLLINSEIQVYNCETDLPVADLALLQEAKAAVNGAYAPYSNFHVGAAVRLENGKIVKGNNQENAAYPSGLCAERVALFYASAAFSTIAIKALAITCKSNCNIIDAPVTPCGSCRQAIAEYEEKYKQPIRIIMSGEKGQVYVCNGIDQLLPLQFNRKQLI